MGVKHRTLVYAGELMMVLSGEELGDSCKQCVESSAIFVCYLRRKIQSVMIEYNHREPVGRTIPLKINFRRQYTRVIL